MSVNFYANYIYPNYTGVVQPHKIDEIIQELKTAILADKSERIQELLNGDLDNEISSKLVSDSLLSLQEGQLSQAHAILHSKAFQEIATENLTAIFDNLISQKKFKITALLLDTDKIYEMQEELFDILERAIITENNDIIEIILNSNKVDEFPEERIKTCFVKAKQTRNLSIIESLLNSRKISLLPDAVVECFINPTNEFDIDIAICIINSRKLSQISDEDLEIAFFNAVNKKTRLVEQILNSYRIDDLSLEILMNTAPHNEAIKIRWKERLHLSNLHENSFKDNLSSYLNIAIYNQDYLDILNILNCKECNNPERFPINQLETIFTSSVYKSHTREILKALLESQRVSEINDYYFKEIIEFLLDNDKDLMQRFICADPERTQKFASYSFEEALSKSYENKIKNFLSLYPNIEINLMPSLISALEEHNLSLAEAFLCTNKIPQEDLLSLTYNTILNQQVDLLHTLVSSSAFIHEKLRSILEMHFSASPFQVTALDYVIKNNLSELTKTILCVDILLKETFPTSKIIKHAIENNKDEILHELLLNCSLLDRKDGLQIIDFAVTKNNLQLLETTLTTVSFSTEDLLPLLNSLVRQNRPQLLEILLHIIPFSEEKLLSSIDLACQLKSTKNLSILASCEQISRKNLLPILQHAVESQQAKVVSAISCSKNIVIDDLQPIFEDSLKNYKLSMIQELTSCKQFSKGYLLKVIEQAIQDKNLPIVKALICSNHFDQDDISSLLHSTSGNLAMIDFFLTILTSDKLNTTLLRDLLNQTTLINPLNKEILVTLKNSYSNDGSVYLQHALETRNTEAATILLEKFNQFSKGYVLNLVEDLIKQNFKTHLLTLLSSYRFTIEELEKFDKMSPDDFKYIFKGKIGSLLEYIS